MNFDFEISRVDSILVAYLRKVDFIIPRLKWNHPFVLSLHVSYSFFFRGLTCFVLIVVALMIFKR